MEYILNEEEKKQFEDFQKFRKDGIPFALIELRNFGGYYLNAMSVFNETEVMTIMKRELDYAVQENDRLIKELNKLTKKKWFW